MKTFLKVAIWSAAVFVGLVVWNVAPDFRPLVSSILAAAFVCYVLSMIVEAAVKRVISDEQLELRSRLEVLDRKVTAILRDAFERRRLR
jgi:predicted PurR-regulated permease PerM